MKATIRIFCLFIRLYGVTFLDMQCNRSKLFNFISSWKIVENTIKLCHIASAFSMKVTKNERQALYIRGHDVTYAECKTL